MDAFDTVNLKKYVNPDVEHGRDDCGQCCRELIMSDIAKEYLDNGKDISYVDFFNKVNLLWYETPLYKRVKSLQDEGKSLKDISKMLEAEGIFI